MAADLKKPAKTPCGSCPYRCDVPAGIWDASEYDKLRGYDGETWEQRPALFLCHQKDGHLCAGWLACHGPDDLLALRLNTVDAAAYNYECPVAVFGSGAEACAHGLSGIAAPSPRAVRLMAGITRKRASAAAET